MRTLVSGGKVGGEDRLAGEEIRAIRERLKRLGYLKEKNERGTGKQSRVLTC